MVTIVNAKTDLMASIAKTTLTTAHQILVQTTVPVMMASAVSRARARRDSREIPAVWTSTIAP